MTKRATSPASGANASANSGPARRLTPRDAATLVIVDRARSAPRVLMGRRHPGQVFLPDTFVFPGGRVEAGDRALARRHVLPASEMESLTHAMRGRPSETRATALALAAIRETFEETGFIVGTPDTDPLPGSEAGGPAGWRPFLAQGFRPRLDGLAFFARAITPPGRPRRYDTRFFIVDAGSATHRSSPVDGELLDIDWFTMKEAERLELPSITRHILTDLERLLNASDKAWSTREIPFYRHLYGHQQRTLLPRHTASGRNDAEHPFDQRQIR